MSSNNYGFHPIFNYISVIKHITIYFFICLGKYSPPGAHLNKKVSFDIIYCILNVLYIIFLIKMLFLAKLPTEPIFTKLVRIATQHLTEKTRSAYEPQTTPPNYPKNRESAKQTDPQRQDYQ